MLPPRWVWPPFQCVPLLTFKFTEKHRMAMSLCGECHFEHGQDTAQVRGCGPIASDPPLRERPFYAPTVIGAMERCTTLFGLEQLTWH